MPPGYGLNLGTGDKRKLSDYLDSVREIERRIQKVEEQNAEESAIARDGPSRRNPAHVRRAHSVDVRPDDRGVPGRSDPRRSLMMIGREGGNRTYRSIGVPDAHHGLSHHFNDAEQDRQAAEDRPAPRGDARATSWTSCKTTKDGDGTLLDHSMIVYGSSISDGNRHQHDNLPTLLAGGGSGQFPGGRHVRYPKGTPMTNLFLTHAGRSRRETRKDRRQHRQSRTPDRSLAPFVAQALVPAASTLLSTPSEA